MVSTALMLLLTGNTYEYSDIRKIISNSDRLLSMILLFDPDTVEEDRIISLAPYILNQNFSINIIYK